MDGTLPQPSTIGKTRKSMCANCKPVGLKLDGDKLVTVYSPAPAETLNEVVVVPHKTRHHGSRPDTDDTWSEMNYARTKGDQ